MLLYYPWFAAGKIQDPKKQSDAACFFKNIFKFIFSSSVIITVVKLVFQIFIIIIIKKKKKKVHEVPTVAQRGNLTAVVEIQVWFPAWCSGLKVSSTAAAAV